MDSTAWYAAVLGGVVSLPLVWSIFLLTFYIFRITGEACSQKYPWYQRMTQHLGSPEETKLFVLLVTFVTGNILALVTNVNDVPEFVVRSGLLTIINLVPLSLGGRMNFIADHCGIKLETWTGMHRWLGRVAIVEGLIHSVAGASYHKLNWRAVPDLAAFAASLTFGLIVLSVLLRVQAYEIFIWLHFFCAVAVIPAVYLHISSSGLFKPPAVYLFATICLWILIASYQFGHLLYRNIRYKKPLCRASVQLLTYKQSYNEIIPVSDAVHVHVRLSTAWKPLPGQYVYLWVQGVSRSSIVQSHPFYVAWMYRDKDGNEYAVFVIQKQRGFTRDIFLHAGIEFSGGSEMRALIDGPYGQGHDLGSYAMVLLFATNIGIVAQLPYVSQLLLDYHNCEAKTRRIALFWQVDAEIHIAWVADRMQELLEQDSNRILDIRVFVTGSFLSKDTEKGDRIQHGNHIDIVYDEMNVENIIESEIKHRRGRTVVSLSVDRATRNKIRTILNRQYNRSIHLKESEFRPTSGSARGLRAVTKLWRP